MDFPAPCIRGGSRRAGKIGDYGCCPTVGSHGGTHFELTNGLVFTPTRNTISIRSMGLSHFPTKGNFR